MYFWGLNQRPGNGFIFALFYLFSFPDLKQFEVVVECMCLQWQILNISGLG